MANTFVRVFKKRGCYLDRLAPELIINIVSMLPDVKSVLALGSTSHKYRAITIHNEGTIARNMAVKILGDDDPEVVRLAFLACKATLIKNPDARLIRKFIKNYVNPADHAPFLYRLRAVDLMGDLSASVELLLDWTSTYATLWPVKVDNRAFTATETTRMRRIIYLAEAGIRLLHTIPKPRVSQLADRFWRSFPLWDVDRAYAFLRMISSSHWCCHDWSLLTAGRGMAEPYGFPWHAHDELREKLYILHFTMWYDNPIMDEPDLVYFLGHPWASHSFCDFFNQCVDRPSLTWTSQRTWYSGLDRDDIEWTTVCGYYDPGVFNLRRNCDWFFLIADEDRRQRVIDQGLIWAWSTEPEGEELTGADPGPAAIVWREDPAHFGWKGPVGRPVPIRDIMTRQYV
ncbi:uncharacterized protein GGS22DRAFT_195994 [Annulohypoxylon maeteangense]|uniref:uncharacterized protein n=1 Tax=Annulohypoxylon maeteangense TaxID=1927788 RepID=UPI0020082615|nr:uncharacterized protein GGS22DRAFT_195994 [Annulohypoxylon maeteangense]KAI0882256.1 hypothetical protein GGS22DRAFT_195994 [Annulohypoxylon maeteangense]